MHTGIFAGYLGKSAELKAMPSGDSVANFSIGVNTGTKDKPSTLWVDCALWGKRAEALCSYLTKGSAVTVCGDVDIRTYTKTDGTSGASMVCRVDKLTFGGKSGDGGYQAPTGNNEPRSPRPAAAKYDMDDPLPF